MNKLILIFSLLLNVGLTLLLLFGRQEKAPGKILANRNKDYDITSFSNFKSVFIEKDDSVYLGLWNQAFQEEPEIAFLLSSSYYHTTKNRDLLKHIELSNSQLKTIYDVAVDFKRRNGECP
ncbi:MAG TPA: hypothetical protein VGD65_03305 [Chryseosolibacter sp.]